MHRAYAGAAHIDPHNFGESAIDMLLLIFHSITNHIGHFRRRCVSLISSPEGQPNELLKLYSGSAYTHFSEASPDTLHYSCSDSWLVRLPDHGGRTESQTGLEHTAPRNSEHSRSQDSR